LRADRHQRVGRHAELRNLLLDRQLLELEVIPHGLRHAVRPLRPDPHLQRRQLIARRALDLCHLHIVQQHDGDGAPHAVAVEERHHAALDRQRAAAQGPRRPRRRLQPAAAVRSRSRSRRCFGRRSRG